MFDGGNFCNKAAKTKNDDEIKKQLFTERIHLNDLQFSVLVLFSTLFIPYIFFLLLRFASKLLPFQHFAADPSSNYSVFTHKTHTIPEMILSVYKFDFASDASLFFSSTFPQHIV